MYKAYVTIYLYSRQTEVVWWVEAHSETEATGKAATAVGNQYERPVLGVRVVGPM